MHQEILSDKQKEVLPAIKAFNADFGLVGGTAVSLQLGHRRSIDFDLFSNKEFSNGRIRKKILEFGEIGHIFVNQEDEYTVLINDVKVTFLYYPFKIEFKESFENIKIADLLTIAALKAYALGRRAKWKDYVDIYFILKEYSIRDIVEKAENIFGLDFNEKIFRSQLSYFDDIDYSEEVEYLPGYQVDRGEIERVLKEKSLE